MNDKEKYILMKKRVYSAISEIKSQCFNDLDIADLENFDDSLLQEVIETYKDNVYYYKHKRRFSLKYCFSKAIEKYYAYYNDVEGLCKTGDEACFTELQHKINAHIRTEIKSSARRFNSLLNFFKVFEFTMTVLLIVFITNISNYFKHGIEGFVFTLIMIIVISAIKVYIDKYMLEPILKKQGWHLYKEAIDRAFAFLIASIMILELIESTNEEIVNTKELVNFKSKVRKSIDIILLDISEQII